MAKSHRDYIPQNAEQFAAWMMVFLPYVQNHYVGWKIPETRVAELVDHEEFFRFALEDSLKTPSHAFILARREEQKTLVAIVRAFVNQFLRFPPITDFDRAQMGINNHDTIRTDHTVVTEKVDFVIHVHSIRELIVDFWQQGADHKAKPRHYDGAVIIWGVRDEAPAHPDELPHHLMASRRPFPLHFDEEERGRTVFMALCWQNERGIRGEWSEYKSAIVP